MMLAAPSEEGTDGRLAQRFDRRVLFSARVLIGLHVVAIVVLAPLASTLLAPLAHLVMALVCYWMAVRTRDGVKFVIFSHVYWTFSVLTYVFAVTRLQAPDFGLGHPDRAALIVLSAQLGLALAFVFSPEGDPLAGLTPPGRQRRKNLADILTWPLLGLGALGMADIVPAAAAQMLTLWFYLGLALLLSRRPGILPTLVGVFAVVALGLAAAGANDRSMLFGVALFLAFLAMMRIERIATLGNAVVFYFGVRLLAAFSAVVLAVRWARGSGLDMAELFAAQFFSFETVWTMVNPLHVHQAEGLAAEATRQSGFQSAFLGPSSDVLGRLTLLPQMDVVTRHIEPLAPGYLDQFWPIVLSVVPNFGQAKQVLFSDVVVWDLGLRAADNIGRPMITAEGELFAIGGYAAVFGVIGICFFVLHLLYRQMIRSLGARAPAILLFSQLMAGTMLSTTLLSTVAGAVRSPLQIIVPLALLAVVSHVLASGRADPRGARA